MPTTTLESELSRLELEVAEAQKSAKVLATALTKIKSAVQSGAIREIQRGLATLEAHGLGAAKAAVKLSEAWTMDAPAYLSGEFVAELREAAEHAGLPIVERDGRLYSFPLLIRVEPDDLAVRVGRRLERGLRPRALVRQLGAIQKRAQRFNTQRFLELLYGVYGKIAGSSFDASDSRGPLRSLAELHGVLTMLPGVEKEYPVEEFGRDLLLLERMPNARTRDGRAIRFEHPAAGGRVTPVRVFDEDGAEHAYYLATFERRA